MKNIKTELVKELLQLLQSKIKENEQAIVNAKESRDSETKSSVGDKYETGRAMVQAELEKHQAQLAQNTKLKNVVSGIKTDAVHTRVQLGSIVRTSNANYFISIPFGKLRMNDEEYYCISLASPIGQELHSKEVGDEISFQAQKFEITDII